MWWWLSRSEERDQETKSDQSALETSAEFTPASRMVDLQQTVGNQSVQRIVSDSRSGDSKRSMAKPIGIGGEPLPPETRKTMETRFGSDFGNVRVHTDQAAGESARALGANAYTSGRDIYFAPGKYAPGDADGTRLLAHELAHTVQQREQNELDGTAAHSDQQADPVKESDALEREAEYASEEVSQNRRPHITKGALAGRAEIQQQPAKPAPTADWQKRLDEMLPGGHGLIFLMHRDMPLLETFGETKLIELVNKVYPNIQARELVHIYGVPALIALDQANLDVLKARQQLEPKVLQDFAAKFPNAADLIRKSTAALMLVSEAEATGAVFGGYAEDGPAPTIGRPYTNVHAVYVPRARTDPIIAMSDFLFELNNAMRAPKVAALAAEAAKGSMGTLTARDYARKIVELEVEGMLRLGETWVKLKTTGGEHSEWDKYDRDFFLEEYEAVKAGRKTKDDLVRDALDRVYESGVTQGKTVEQYYMDRYNTLSGGR